MKFLFVLSIFGLGSYAYINRDRPDEGAEWSDALLDTVSIIRKYKYPVEEHEVTTSDGYILTVHRIPRGRTCLRETPKGPVILQHGLFAASAFWILAGTRRGLAYILADSCYDVWMPNSRGNSLSLRHVKYSSKEAAFWNFSWHEMGVFDHPAVFDYILNVTGSENVTYIGHSQGTTNFFVFNLFHPEYNEKIRAAFLLAPISYMSHSKSLLLQAISQLVKPIQFTADVLGIYDIVQQKAFFSNLTDVVCTSLKPINPFLCENTLFLATGFDNEQSNLTLFTILFRNEAYGSSIKQLVHYGQLIRSGKFQQFDYGIENTNIYGEAAVPQYDLTQVKAPIHLFIAANDWLSDLTDVFQLTKQLPNLKEQYLIPFEKFNHLDHLYAKDVVDLEYDHLVEQLDRYYAND